MKLTLAGVSHHNAPIELRERVALDLDACRALAQRLDGEAVVLSTCNRTELYLVREEHADDEAVAALMQLAGERADDLAAALYRLRDEAAALHLFRVAAGLDSLVPGEGEILGPGAGGVRSRRGGPVPRPALSAGAAHGEARSDGDRDRREPGVGPVGGGSARPAGVRRPDRTPRPPARGREDQRVRCSQPPSRAARRSRVVANRTLAHGEDLARKLGARALALDAVATELEQADVVVSATSASELVLSRESVAAALRARKGRPLLLLDLAVPRDLDPAINELDGCFLYDVDDLEAVVTETLSGRRGEAARAEQLVAGEADRFREWQASLDIVPTIASLRALAEEIRDRELAEGRRQALRARAQAHRIRDLPDRRKAPAFAHDPSERGSCGSRWSGLC